MKEKITMMFNRTEVVKKKTLNTVEELKKEEIYVKNQKDKNDNAKFSCD